MNAQVQNFETSLLQSPDIALLAFAWRGACLELFARIELDVGETLDAITTRKLALDKEAVHPGAKARYRSLAGALKIHPLGRHAQSTVRRLEEWCELHEDRVWLAHGRFRALTDGLSIELVTYDGKSRNAPDPVVLTRMDMLTKLTKLSACATSLHGQLGQIRKACRELPQPL